jgi:hypothetical protein
MDPLLGLALLDYCVGEAVGCCADEECGIYHCVSMASSTTVTTMITINL